jgi:hypothetical protein
MDGVTAARARLWLLPMILGVAAVCLVAYFDFSRVPSIGDDSVYAWDVRHLVGTHKIGLFPEQSALALVQIAWSSVATLGNTGTTVLRLSLLPFLIWIGVSTWRLAGACGADRFWRAVAVGAVLCSPAVAVLSVGFGSDVVYFALLMATGWHATTWVLKGRDRALTVALAAATTLQRQVGLVVALAVLVALLSNRRNRALTRRDWLGLGALCAGVTLAALVPFVTALGTPAQRSSSLLNEASTLQPAAQALLRYAPVLGLMALPFAAAVLAWRPVSSTRPSWIAIVVGFAGVVTVASFVNNPSAIFGGDLWTAAGIHSDRAMPGMKPPLFGGWFEVIALLSAGCFVVLLIARSRIWSRGRENPAARLMMFLAGAQLALLFAVQSQDRYLAGAVLPLLPVLAGVATESPRFHTAGVAWSILALLGFVAFFGVGQQDHLAWEDARTDLARSLLATTPGFQLQLGYNLNESLVAIPYFDQTGRLPPDAPQNVRIPWALVGPSAPRYTLCYASRGDPRPGRDYTSAAPGRIVVAQGRPDSSCRSGP